MDEIQVVMTLKCVFMITGIVGVLVGLDFISGARFSIALKRVLDKAFDVDKLLLDLKTRKILGVIILILSLVILFFISRTRL
ncbi:MAG: hypothetical protein A3K54_00545 [Omnitrophica WOR_2 bacterium RBG_13_44_8]|nr:MAG: hypothetical protein A3K54_00545 [Omnitrophica WOR_2 bacterium RBG_13_44_8]